jgi:hypothetical protein
VPTEVDDERGLGVADDESEAVSPTVATAIGLCVGVTVLFGVWPAPLLDFAHQATLLLH